MLKRITSICFTARTIPAVLAAMIGICGCAAPKKANPQISHDHTAVPMAPISNTDACATRLQDMCGGLLLYYQINGQLPATLEEIRNFPGEEEVKGFFCPVSKQPYVYVLNGIFLPERNTRIIIYDPAPSHSHMRWAISIGEPEPGRPLVTKVIALPETFFLLRR